MPIFLSPFWLLPILPIAAIGLIALWRGRHHLQRVSSTKLWSGLSSQRAGKKSRSLDPIWALLLLAALLAALALARPAWRSGPVPAPPPPPLQMAIRGIAGQPTAELFVRSPPDTPLPNPLTLTIGTATKPLIISPQTLHHGTVLSDIPNAASIKVDVSDGTSSHVYSFTRQDAPPFTVLRIGSPMPALERIIALQPGAQNGDIAQPNTIWLVDDPSFRQSDIDAYSHGIVILSPRTPASGITPIAAPANTAPPTALPRAFTPAIAARSPLLANVSFQDVRVYHWTSVNVSPDWTILATVDGHPWLASRTDPQSHILWIWLASTLSPKDTNWPLDPSFVIFFSNVAAQLRDAQATSGHILNWTLKSTPEPATAEAAPTYPIALAIPLVLCSLLLIIAVMIILARRA